MTVKTRLEKLEGKSSRAVIGRAPMPPDQYIEEIVKYCMNLFGYSEQETRERLQPDFDECIKEYNPLELIYRTNEDDAELDDATLDGHINELIRKTLGHYFKESEPIVYPVFDRIAEVKYKFNNVKKSALTGDEAEDTMLKAESEKIDTKDKVEQAVIHKKRPKSGFLDELDRW